MSIPRKVSWRNPTWPRKQPWTYSVPSTPTEKAISAVSRKLLSAFSRRPPMVTPRANGPSWQRPRPPMWSCSPAPRTLKPRKQPYLSDLTLVRLLTIYLQCGHIPRRWSPGSPELGIYQDLAATTQPKLPAIVELDSQWTGGEVFAEAAAELQSSIR